jgi:transposase-like protein
MTVAAAAAALNVAPSTLHRWLNDGILAGEQDTPGAPWRIRLPAELKARFTEAAGDGFVTMQEATRALGVTRQTVLHRVKRGELKAAHVTKGGKRGLRIKMIAAQPSPLLANSHKPGGSMKQYPNIARCRYPIPTHRSPA